MLDKPDGWLISEFDFEIRYIKGKENRVTYALSSSMQTLHLVASSVGEFDIKQRIKTLLQEYELFNQVIKWLQQKPREKRYE
jgi:hypothetical protein